MNKQQGFTLIELVIVIVILGILSAVALPRFINVASDARSASVDGVAGAIRSSVALAKAQYIIDGDTTSSSIDMDGTTVSVVAVSGLPLATSSGIELALQNVDGFAVGHPGGSSTFQPTNGGSAGCRATYTQATGLTTTSTGSC